MSDANNERETLWAEGAWSAAVTPRGVLLLPPEVPEELVTQLWRLLRSPDGGLTAILDRLVMGTGGHLARIPDFALVLLEDSGTHLALRGTPSLEVDGQRLDAAKVATWVEASLPGEPGISLSVPGQPGTVLRPVVDAVLRAGRLQLGAPDTGSAAENTDSEQADAAAPEPDIQPETVEPDTQPETVEPDAAQPEVDSGAGATDDSAPDSPPAVGRDSEATPEPEQTAESQDRPGDHDGWTVADLPEDLVDELGRMLPDQQEQADSGSAAPSPAAHTEVPETENTRMALSVVCPSGHANPTNYVTCRECGAELTQPARIIPCPPLGRVRVSSGGEVVLDQPVLVGREPSPDGVSELGGATPALITVPSPEQVISRNHLLIQLDEWSVLARSLSTANGTVLRRDGAAPMRMPPTEPVLLRSGDILDLGDGQSLLLEDLP
ncbi:FHA domain-containing protein [Actinomyces sp. Z5]|uniref:FHA domain-containing protein n=1 Tax=Actinomyces sp. Z5 TaxID=2250216 RepID=UPI00215BB807|nr:FHA domain-containing protein [Actinomyces sp. Z5]